MERMSLKAARVNANYTIKKASKLIGVSEPTLRSWENGDTYPRVDQLILIEKVYKIPYDKIKFLNIKHG